MKGPSERGLTAQRLRDVRLQAGYTNQKAAAAHVRDVTGVIGLTDSQWASYESGDPRRPFQQKHREAIESVFGPLGDTRPERGEGGTTPDLSALLAALTEQSRQQAQLIALLTEQNAMLKRLLPAAPAPVESDPLAPMPGPLPRLGLARAVRTLAAMGTAEDTPAVPASDPDTASKRPGAR